MRHVFLVALFCFIAALGALAEDNAASQPNVETSADRVQLVEDEEHGAIRFVIDGKEVGRFDADGLHVENMIAPGTLVLPREAIPDWNRRKAGDAP